MIEIIDTKQEKAIKRLESIDWIPIEERLRSRRLVGSGGAR